MSSAKESGGGAERAWSAWRAGLLSLVALSVFGSSLFFGRVLAGLPPSTGEVYELDLVRDGEARTGLCTVSYYNICSGYIHLYAWSLATEEAGVVFDLPTDCQKTPGEACTNLEFWWYWRYTHPGYGFTISYGLYASDENFCKAGPPIGSLDGQDPIERWNHYPGLGETTSDLVILMAMLDKGGWPFVVTDNAERNQQVGCAQPPPAAHSFYYGFITTQYCPPQAWVDNIGFVNILMDASFSCEETPVERASWGAIKTLFR